MKKYYIVFDGGEIEIKDKDYKLSDIIKILVDNGHTDVALSYKFGFKSVEADNDKT